MAVPARPVCVVIPVFDAAATVARAVRSALAQPEVGEVVVVDDGSADATGQAALAAAAGDGRLAVIRLPTNRGPAAARNAAIAASNAPLVAILDADDYLLPGRFSRLDLDGGWDLIADNILFLPEGQEAGDGAALPKIAGRRRRLEFAEFVARNMPRRGAPRAEFGFLKPVIRRATLTRLGLRYDDRLRLGEDFILYATALARGARFELSAPCGYVAIERAGSLSGRHATADLAALAEAEAALLGEVAAMPGGRRDAALLARHLAGVRGKVAHRQFLDRKAQHGLLAAASAQLFPPQQLLDVAWRVLRDKLPAAGGGAAAPRLLLHATEFTQAPAA